MKGKRFLALMLTAAMIMTQSTGLMATVSADDYVLAAEDDALLAEDAAYETADAELPEGITYEEELPGKEEVPEEAAVYDEAEVPIEAEDDEVLPEEAGVEVGEELVEDPEEDLNAYEEISEEEVSGEEASEEALAAESEEEALVGEGQVTITLDLNGGYTELYDPTTGSNIKDDTQIRTAAVNSGAGTTLYELFFNNSSGYWPNFCSTDANKGFAGFETENKIIDYAGDWFYPEDDMTFTVIWNDYCDVSFDPNEGFFPGMPEDQQTQPYVNKAVIGRRAGEVEQPYVESSDPSKVFGGWGLSEGSTESVDLYEYRITGPVTFYARWAEECQVTLLAGENGYFNDSDPETGDPIHKEQVTLHGVVGSRLYLNWPSTDYNNHFVGWSENGVLVKDASDNSYYPKGDVTLTAVWEPNEYEITLHANNGTFYDNDEATYSEDVYYGYDIRDRWFTTPESNDPFLVFSDWSLTADGSRPLSKETDPVYPRDCKDLYAVYEDLFDAQGAYTSGEKEYPVKAGRGVSFTFTPSADGTYEIEARTKEEDEMRIRMIVACGSDILTSNTSSWDKVSYIIRGEAGKTYKIGLIDKYYDDDEDEPETDSSLLVNIKDTDAVTVTFDGNGGSFYSYDTHKYEPTLTATRVSGTYYVDFNSDWFYGDDYQAPNGDPSMLFGGWSLTKGGTTPVEWSDVPTYDCTLFAIWEKACKITFDFNGGAIDDETQTVRYLRKGEKLSYAFGSDNSIRKEEDASLRVIGWSTDETATSGEKLDNITAAGDATYYAVWTKGYAVTLDANGGYFRGNKETTVSGYVTPGDSLGSASPFSRYKKNSYVLHEDSLKYLIGWSEDSSATTGSKLTKLVPTKDNTTYYAIWDTKIKLTFHATEGSSFEEGALTSTSYEKKGVQLEDIEGNYLEKKPEDKVFVGWSLTENGEALKYSYEFKADADLFPVWADKIELTFDAGDGYFESWDDEEDDYQIAKTVTQAYAKGRTIGYDYPYAYHDGPDMQFIGWSLTEGGKETIDTDAYEVTAPVTLYAVFDEVIRITFFCNTESGRGKIGGSSTISQRVSKGAVLSEDAHLQATPADEHYSFNYWSTDYEGKNKVDLGTYKVTTSVAFYAQWKALHFVTLDANGGYFSTKTETTYRAVAEAGKALAYLPSDTPTSNTAGQVFDKWAYDKAGTKPINSSLGAFIPRGDVTLYAIYKAAPQPAPQPQPKPQPQPAKPVQTLANDGTKVGKGADAAAAAAAITGAKTSGTDESDGPSGAVYGQLNLQLKKAEKKALTVKWKSVSGAKQYVVFSAPCGSKMKEVKRTTGTTYKATNLASGKSYKFIVMAVDGSNKVVSTSKVIHVYTKGGKSKKTSNPTAVKVKSTKVKLSLKSRKTKNFSLNGKVVSKGKMHRKIKYESSNPAIATVNAKGKITAKAAGKCKIFAYAASGLCKTVNVTVKKK